MRISETQTVCSPDYNCTRWSVFIFVKVLPGCFTVNIHVCGEAKRERYVIGLKGNHTGSCSLLGFSCRCIPSSLYTVRNSSSDNRLRSRSFCFSWVILPVCLFQTQSSHPRLLGSDILYDGELVDLLTWSIYTMESDLFLLFGWWKHFRSLWEENQHGCPLQPVDF